LGGPRGSKGGLATNPETKKERSRKKRGMGRKEKTSPERKGGASAGRPELAAVTGEKRRRVVETRRGDTSEVSSSAGSGGKGGGPIDEFLRREGEFVVLRSLERAL